MDIRTAVRGLVGGARWPWWSELLVLGAVLAISLNWHAGVDSRIPGRYAGLVVTVVAVAALAVRRRWPLPVAVLALAAYGTDGLWWPLLVALLAVAVRCHPVVSLAFGVAATLAVTLLPGWPDASGPPLVQFSVAPLLLAPLGFGLALRNRQMLVASLAREVTALRTERELRAEQARLAERARIAREMHDVVAHRLSLLALHTGVLALRADDVPPPVAERLTVIRRTSAQALDELRELLGALRGPESPWQPTPTDLDALFAEARAAGTDLTVRVAPSDGLPTAVRLAAYRIVQECLTNARRHAPGAPVSVGMSRTDRDLTIAVTNPVESTVDTDRTGYGLVGLAERVDALDGTLDAGPHGGEFRVRATLPLRPEPTP
ncbi:sensor histidine kinase [Actinocatenispora rupis]|uniref:histidine kinase n=1 Tax=Actinocatenispora rupis TaxID=519421 RepID=A0A8J3IVK9_9ACTN|nr:histidine kinase [Actinocatenispora rupis]GID10766.1 hypothetical protein Aru02nite_16550 [Actinocatenispora rupis]